MLLNSVEEIIEEMRQGKMVVLMDDEDRENEGDLIMAAECATPEAINFMARYARGLICLPLTRERCEQLALPLMVSDNNAKHATNFTVSIEAAEGVTTGISAADRATTVLAAVNADAKPEDIAQPGHIFPLMAQTGGVLTRAGHTEAGCDLARLAGFEAAAVIVEILNEDGSMARRPELEVFAKEHNLKIGTVADLIQYRLRHERTVERVAECDFPSGYGQFRMYAYQDYEGQGAHIALVKGKIDRDQPVLVRVHLLSMIDDVLLSQREEGRSAFPDVMAQVAEADNAVVIMLRRPYDPVDMVRRVREYQLQDRGVNLPKPAQGPDMRSYGIGAQMLADLGVGKMRIVGSAKRMHGLSGFGLEVVEYV